MTEDLFSSTHPKLPPTTEEFRYSWLRLLRSRRVGPTTFHKLMAEHGDAQAALNALPDIARAAGVKSYQICPEAVVETELRAADAFGAKMICIGDPVYPADLAELSDAPPILWAYGDVSLLCRPKIALVGARNASSLGTRMARALARDLGALGHVIVSGLARGIDAAAHSAVIETGTIAVFAGGLDVIYPSENTSLAHEIAAQGLILTEQPMGLQPQARHFPARNRIVSGLSRAVVVVEAAARSGSLITARNALDQGREVLAVPGHPFDARAAGCNMLIRDGASLIRNAEDVVTALGPPAAQTPRPAPTAAASTSSKPKRTLRETAQLHTQILKRLGPSPVAEDQLIRDLNVSANQITPVLIDLELEGEIIRRSGGLLCKT